MDMYYRVFNGIAYFLTLFQQRFIIYFYRTFCRRNKISNPNWNLYGLLAELRPVMNWDKGNTRELLSPMQNSKKSCMKYFAKGFYSYFAYILGMSSKSVLKRECTIRPTCSCSSKFASQLLTPFVLIMYNLNKLSLILSICFYLSSPSLQSVYNEEKEVAFPLSSAIHSPLPG